MVIFNSYVSLPEGIYVRSKPDGMIIPLGLSRRGQVMVAMVDTL
jgi:hypothetical protein